MENDYSERMRELDEVTEEISNKYGEKWDSFANRKFCDLSSEEKLEFLKITFEGMQLARAKRDKAKLKKEVKDNK